MAQTFPVPTLQEVATAGKEIIARIKDDTFDDDIPLAVNQIACGIAPYVVTFFTGEPKPIIGMKQPSLDECEKQLAEIEAKGEAAIPKTGVKDQLMKMLIKVVLTAAIAKIPEPYKSQIQALLDQFLT